MGNIKMFENLIKKLNLTEKEVLSIVHEWYTMGLYADILQDEDGNDLEEICERRFAFIDMEKK